VVVTACSINYGAVGVLTPLRSGLDEPEVERQSTWAQLGLLNSRNGRKVTISMAETILRMLKLLEAQVPGAGLSVK
jgi:hypothetical protein